MIRHGLSAIHPAISTAQGAGVLTPNAAHTPASNQEPAPKHQGNAFGMPISAPQTIQISRQPRGYPRVRLPPNPKSP